MEFFLHMLGHLCEARWPITAVLLDEAATKRSDHYLDLKTEQWELAEEMIKVFATICSGHHILQL